MTPTDNDTLIGFARLGLSGVKAAKLGYVIAADHTDAACTLTTYGFTTLGLHRITAAIGPDNAASIAVVTCLGFSREGQLRDHVFTNGSATASEPALKVANELPQAVNPAPMRNPSQP